MLAATPFLAIVILYDNTIDRPICAALSGAREKRARLTGFGLAAANLYK
jgi:hypothetical protein